MLGVGKNTVEIIIAARDRTQAAFAKVNMQMKTMTASSGRLGGAMNNLKGGFSNLTGSVGKLGAALGPLGLAAVAAAAAVAVVSLGVAAVKSFTAFEDAMANVRKTTGFTKDEIKVLGDAINDMALRIPVAQTELAAIAAIAGQLGIQGRDSILGFTEDVAKMSTAFDMSSESAATAMAKMSNIYGIPIEQASALGSAINVLGNTTAAKETEIMNFSMALGASAKQLGFCATEAVAMGATLISMGVDASDAGTRLNAAFTRISTNIDKVSSFLNITGEEFKAAFGDDPMAMLSRIIEKIAQIKDPLEKNAVSVDIFGRIGAKSINALSGNLEGLETNLANSAKGFKENTSLTEEFAAKTDTLKAKFALVKNASESFKIKIGEALAPLAGALAEGAINTITGLSAAFDLIKQQVEKLKLALAPLTNLISDLFNKLSGGRGIFQIYIDYLTILWAGVKLWGDVIIWLVKHAIILLVNHIRETIKELTAFYNKLGPLKDLIGFVKGAVDKGVEGFHNYAESFREVEKEADNLMDRLDAVIVDLEGVTDKVAGIPKVIVKEWKKAVDAFEEGTGSYKDAIGAIDAEIEKLTALWKRASEDEKATYEDWIRHLYEKKEAMIEADKISTETLNRNIGLTKEAIEKTKEFIVTIGDTTIEFKGAAAEVLKNADAYEKLHKAAKTFTDLDWSVFIEFEAALPTINAGIGDMESSFVGFADILEDNIDKLENVKLAVMDISEVTAPFLEKGFLEGIKAIGNFAGALKDAGSAINTFAGLQDVSIEGCIKFSEHIYDMVTALEILESQMEDLVPAFGDMDSLITDIADAFLYGGDKMAGFVDTFDFAISSSKGILDSGAENFNEFRDIVGKALDAGELTYLADTYITETDLFQKKWKTITVEGAEDVRQAMHGWMGDLTPEFETTVGTITSGTDEIYDAYSKATMNLHNWVLETYGLRISQEELYAVMESPPEEQKKWLDDIMHSETALTFQMDKQTNALKAQTEQLNKITEALQPYLEFMRTLNELAALSTLSTDELNNGLNAIKDTLVNLGKALSDFDLRPVMESLFGTKITEGDLVKFTGGAAKGFMDTMSTYQSQFAILEDQILRFTSAILNLVNAFEALANIGDSVLADQTKLKEVFEGVTGVMTNFSTEMGGTEGFAQKFAEGMDAMLKSAEPLMKYFQDNKEAITLFNSSLRDFRATITNIISVFEDLASAVKRSSELVVISTKDMEAALALIPAQLGEIAVFLGRDIWGDIVNGLSAVDFSWKTYAKTVDDSMPAFTSAMDTFSTLISKILSLSVALKDMRDMTVLSVRDIDEALKNIPVFLDRFVDALALNMHAIKQSLKELDVEWQKHAEEMRNTMPSYEDSTSAIGKLIGSLLSLGSALKSLAETGIITEREFDVGFKSLMTSISNFAVSLTNNVDDLISSLQKLRVVWMENEDVLFPLIRDFAIITDNLWGVAHNANRMAEEFSNVSKNAGTLERGFKSLIEFIDQVVESTEEFYTPEAAAEIAGFITDVGKVTDAFVGLERKLKDAMGTIKKAIGGAVDDIEGKISSLSTLSTSAFWWGANMMGSYVNGIYSMSAYLREALEAHAGLVESYLGTYSNAKTGPLSHLEEWPRNLIQSYSTGIEAEMHTLNTSFAGMVAGQASISAGGGNRSIVINNTQYISDRATADYANRDLERLMYKHAVM